MILRPVPIALLALVAANLAMLAIALSRYPLFFSQPGALLVVLEPVFALFAYVAAIIWCARFQRLDDWQAALKIATLFGVFGGCVDILNIALENGIPVSIHIPGLSLALTLILFASWAIAGYRAAHSLRSFRAGLLAAVASAAICMMIAVTGGFVIQFFAASPDPSYVSTWAEFKRSGWTDARAFGLAGTLDSAFSHLAIAPVVALVLGAISSFVARLTYSTNT